MNLRKNNQSGDETSGLDSKAYMDRKLSWNARLELARKSREAVLDKKGGQSILPERKPWETEPKDISDPLDNLAESTPEEAQRIARENRTEFISRMEQERARSDQSKPVSAGGRDDRGSIESEASSDRPEIQPASNVLPLFGEKGGPVRSDADDHAEAPQKRLRQPPHLERNISAARETVSEDETSHVGARFVAVPAEERRTAKGFFRIAAVVLLCLLVGAAVAFVASRAVDRVAGIPERVSGISGQ